LPPLLIQRRQFCPIARVLTAIEQPGDPVGIDPQGLDLLPDPPAEGRLGLIELGSGQLAHQQEHQLLLLQLGEGAGRHA
jgi:hypothetical protein